VRRVLIEQGDVETLGAQFHAAVPGTLRPLGHLPHQSVDQNRLPGVA
jgi:hypothetical protein